MNNRIKELALKANLDYDTHIPDAWTCESQDLERFARLIIEECINSIDDERSALDIFGDSDPYELIATYTNSIKFSIQRKIGVE